jgi:hypothetical protein
MRKPSMLRISMRAEASVEYTDRKKPPSGSPTGASEQRNSKAVLERLDQF